MPQGYVDIIGYEGLYQIDPTGRVFAYSRYVKNGKNSRRLIPLHIVKPFNRCGYMWVKLNKNGIRKGHSVHRLVATHFITNPHNKPQVNHKNGNKTDNRASNLEWCTNSENAKHAYMAGLANNQGEKHPRSKLTEENVIEIRRLAWNFLMSTKDIAEKFGVSARTVHDVCNKRTWAHISY